MKLTELELKWEQLSEIGLKSGYKILRIDSICIPDLFIGVDQSNQRCLILSLPNDYDIKFKSNTKENISIEFNKEPNYIVLLLTESDYHDLFNDLIFSIYNRIKNEENIDIYSKELIRLYYKWSIFFSERKKDSLSREMIKGLFGELIFLELIVRDTDGEKINDVLRCWRGPYDEGHDFILNGKDTEIKTKDDSKTNIRISSEHQLENEIGKKLELSVFSVDLNTVKGRSIKDVAFNIKDMVLSIPGDITIFLEALSQKNLTFKNIGKYDNLRFILTEIITYDCCKEGFPKITTKTLPPGLRKVQYDINTNVLHPFIIP